VLAVRSDHHGARRFGWIPAAAVLVLAGLLAGCGNRSDSVDATAAANVRAAAQGATFNGFALGHPLAKPAVTLTDTAGKPYDMAARTRGKVTLLYYGFTHCDDTCPAVMAATAQALRGLPASAARQVRVIFVTTDPDRDTPQVLRHWLDKYSTSFVGLTGPKSKLANAYRVVGMPQPVKEPNRDGGYDVVHGSDTYVYGLHNKALLAEGPNTAPKEIAHDIRLLQAGHTPPPISLAQPEESGANSAVGAVRVATAFIPQPKPGGPVVVEMTLANTADSPDRLTSVTTSLPGRVSIVSGPSGRTLPALDLGPVEKPNGIAVLSGSGPHLLVTGLDSDAPPVRKGQLVKVTLVFANAGRGNITVPVVGPAGPGTR
jgi:cytochrome oxidase Cu insertion factor (SCO1/SenC/PrrC family)/copper(I)-binding protein